MQPGDYRIHFYLICSYSNVHQYFDDATTSASAKRIAVAESEHVTAIDAGIRWSVSPSRAVSLGSDAS